MQIIAAIEYDRILRPRHDAVLSAQAVNPKPHFARFLDR